jgi:hypothetical protein
VKALTFSSLYAPQKICDFICLENIKSLIDFIVTKHLNRENPPSSVDANSLSLEDIANPHVGTFKQLRKIYDDERSKPKQQEGRPPLLGSDLKMIGSSSDLQLNRGVKIMLNEKALEDQASTPI